MIRWVEDLGAPALVAGVDIAVTEWKPEWSKYASLGMALLGYGVGGVAGIGGNFVKNIGVAAAPGALKYVYEWIKGTTPATSFAPVQERLRMQPAARLQGGSIQRYPAPAYAKEFQGVRMD